jgi:endoglucanase
MKKLISILVASALLANSALPYFSKNKVEAVDTIVKASGKFNYGEALQKSLFFYECQQAGPLPEWNRVEWRSDSTVDDFITGGWYDAGDHVNFNLPMSYSASMLAWGLYEYGDAVEQIGQYDIYKNNLEFALDYFVKCDLGDEVIFQVGNGTEDHTWWGPVELLEYGIVEGSYYKRPYYTGTGSAVTAGMAAALAAGACALKGKTSKTSEYIKHAENMFKIADTSRSDSDYNKSDASGFYRSSHFYDELFWAANWLYMATGEKAYLDKAESYIPNLGKEMGSTDLKYSWAHCWDDVQQGGTLLYAINTKDPVYINQVKKHLNYWTDSVTKIDGGLRWLSTWGCLRYATAAGFVTAVANDRLITDATEKAKYKKFYEEQVNYALGDNPDGRSYVVGFGENPPKNPHHRTAHGSWENALANPEVNRHILYGALVGGPTESGAYEDDRQNFINNEVATDYNAGYTALLCKMISEYGGAPDTSFPQPETRTPEFFVEAELKQNTTSSSTASLKFTNNTAWPARIVDNVSLRYYVDLSEVLAAGHKASDVVIRVDRDQSKMYSDVKPAVISELIQYKNTNTYYVEIAYPDGRAAMPISAGRYQCETLLSLVFPNYGSGWNASNDYSNKDLLNIEGSMVTDKITVYENGKLIFGVEPDGTAASTEPTVTTTKPTTTTTTVTTTATTTVTTTENPTLTTIASTTKVTPIDTTTTKVESTTKYGDINKDGGVNNGDLVLLCQYLIKDAELTSEKLIFADVTADGEVDVADVAQIKQFLLGDIVTLGPKK